ncbi:hypothetical protein PG994_014187 [Apiospora phragmitis]|uniref:Sugar phosphate transporter domain-containing protein n=1 Tax=Apiospora phragmitis TaxID=2905665 RepID=A0ABR1T5D0_9PEZI
MAKPILPTSLPDIRAGLSLHPAFYVASWIFFSNLTILFNKWLIDDAGFPVILTWWHMTFATLATQFLARTTTLLDNRHSVKMTRPFYLKAVVPIGLLYSVSMVCSNLVYLYLNVAFIQMLKAASPFSTLVIAWLWGQEHPTTPMILKILVIILGVLVASAGEIHFSWIGFSFQLGGLVFESIRVVMIQDLMSGGGGDDAGRSTMDPLVSLYYYAPVCAVTNFFVAWATEWPTFAWSNFVGAGPWVLVLNGLVAFLLNVSSVMLIGKTSGLVLHLTGILKNILLVVASVFIWGTAVSPVQILGYGTALTGFVFYKSSWSDLKAGYSSWSARLRASPRLVERLPGPVVRRILGLLLAIFMLMAVLKYTPSGYLGYRAISLPPDRSSADNLPKGWHMPGFKYGGK